MVKPLSPVLISKVIEPNQAQFKLHIPQNLFYLSGHFPEYPIVPGVVQIQWVADFAQTLIQNMTEFDLQKIKFMRPILPNAKIQLNIKVDRKKLQIDFKYADDRSSFSTGLFKYG